MRTELIEKIDERLKLSDKFNQDSPEILCLYKCKQALLFFQDSCVLLDEGSEAQAGDLILNKAGYPKWVEHGKYHSCSVHDCKIIQRAGKPVIIVPKDLINGGE